MFCNQCEQTVQGKGCTKVGVCSKEPILSNTMDCLIYILRRNSMIALKAREQGIIDREFDKKICCCLFSTLTNVNFNRKELKRMVEEVETIGKEIKSKLTCNKEECKCNYVDIENIETFIESNQETYRPNKFNENEDIQSLMQTILFGLKGISAYVSHCFAFNKYNDEIFTFVHKALVAGYDGKERTLQDWIDLTLEVGKWNLETMKLLDESNNTLGHPKPTDVLIGHKKGKCILITGHDLNDLRLLLEQTKDKGINIYTHGEMLPSHGYPELKKYPHLVGHFGTAWQNQQKEFPDFPGAILYTTNCLMKPLDSYKEKIFTTNEVGFEGVPHIPSLDLLKNKDFTPVINKALELPGFEDDCEEDHILTGFSHHAVLDESVSSKLVSLIKEGKIKTVYVIGGCDGIKSARSYYSEIVHKVPKESIILTCGCGKYKFYREKLGDIEGIPRLLDLGQCNDSYSAVVIAVKLAEVFGCGVNDLPLKIILSWYEQKAVSVLLTLLYLGIKNIKIGPSPPAFLTPTVFNFLHDTFNLSLITTPENDI